MFTTQIVAILAMVVLVPVAITAGWYAIWHTLHPEPWQMLDAQDGE